MGALKDAVSSRDFRSFKLAAEALGALDSGQVARISQMLLETDDPKAIDLLARELVRYGGKEGLLAVAQVARSDRLGIDARGRAIEALSEAPPERRGEAIAQLAEIIGSGLPGKLQFHSAHVYARMLGAEAMPGLLELLDSGNVRAEPLLAAMGDFARAEDLPKLKDLLTRIPGRESQEMLLRAIGRAAGPDGARTLLDYLQNPPEGIQREAVGWPLDDFVRKEDLPLLWDALAGEGDRKVQAALARAIARTGGPEAIDKLLKMASDPESGLSQEALARALHETAGKETVPVMFDLLKGAKGWETAEPLAHGIARVSGRDGIERLLDIAAEGGPEDRRRAIIQAIEDFGDPGYVGRLGELYAKEEEQGVAFHLAKAILRLDPEKGLETIAASLGSAQDPGQRAAVAQVLEKEGNASLIPTVEKVLLSERDERAQWHMARTIASYGPAGMEALGEILASDPDPRRRASILRGASSLREEGIVPISRSLFREDPSPDVRATAAKILGISRDPGVAQDLQLALSSETEPRVREAIEVALKEIRSR